MIDVHRTQLRAVGPHAPQRKCSRGVLPAAGHFARVRRDHDPSRRPGADRVPDPCSRPFRTWWPVSRRDADGNTYQRRTLDDGSEHEVVKNFPDRDGALTAAGERVRQPVWREHVHYWVLSYTLA